MAFGTCRLTRKNGTFVRSHLLPKALTKLSSEGHPYIESGLGARPVRRMDSWYDDELVVREGERILEVHDTWAIGALRAHRLVWSGWAGATALPDELTEVDSHPVRIREVTGLDSRKLRLFFLSLLWRAGATDRPEFKLVSVAPPNLERIRRILNGEENDAADFYPTVLTQFSTTGAHHNHTPIVQRDWCRDFEGLPDCAFPCIRFYFDGLIARMYEPPNGRLLDYVGSFCLSFDAPMLVTAIPFQNSRQERDIGDVIVDAETRWPGAAGRAGGQRRKN